MPVPGSIDGGHVSRTTFARLALIAVAGALIPASTASATTLTQAYSTAGEHAFVVPPAVTSVNVVLVGADGGSGTSGGGGPGATFGATIAVTPGQTLFAEVGGNGHVAADDGLGGGGGGGAGGDAVFLFVGAPGGGGGGGASDVRTCSTLAPSPACSGGSSLATRLAVAGGGAGGGGEGTDASAKGSILGGTGGSGGGPGGPGGPDPHGDLGGLPGQAGNQDSGGAEGGNSAETPATPGQLGTGGNGGTAPAGGGGGGGGGLYGGGGGGAGITTIVDPNKIILATAGGGGGGGGASGVPTGATGVSAAGNQQTKPGGASVTFSWAAPGPAAVSAPASSVTSGGAVLGGSVDPHGSPISDCHFEVTPAPAGGASDVPCAQQVGAGSGAVDVSANVAGLTGATAYRYRLHASSAEGSSVGDQVDFTTAPDGGGPAGGGQGDAATLTAFSLTPSRFRTRAGHGRVGTTIAFMASGAARVTVRFERVRAGSVRGGRCVPAAARKGTKRCTRYTKLRGTLRLTAAATGRKQRVRFLGKVAGRRLAPGAYRVSAIATGTSGASAPRRATATVLATRPR
jgi:hypothetical protein